MPNETPVCEHCGSRCTEALPEPTLYRYWCDGCSRTFGAKTDAELQARILPRFSLNSRHDPKD